MIPGQFRLNTFSVEEYAKALPDRLPGALVMPVSLRLEMAYWLYWRAYEMRIPDAPFRLLFGRDLEGVFGVPLAALRRLGMLRRGDGGYEVTESAAYWIHRVQNEYALNYVDRLWGRCREEAWPVEVQREVSERVLEKWSKALSLAGGRLMLVLFNEKRRGRQEYLLRQAVQRQQLPDGMVLLTSLEAMAAGNMRWTPLRTANRTQG